MIRLAIAGTLQAACCGLHAQEAPPPPYSARRELLELLDSESADVRLAAVEQIARLRGSWFHGRPSETAVVPLLHLLEKESDEDVAVVCALTLQDIVPERSAVLRHLASRLHAWASADCPPRAIAALAKALAEPDTPGTVGKLVPHLLEVSRGPAGREALAMLALLGPDAAAAAPALQDALPRGGSERWRMVWALAASGASDPAAFFALLADRDPRVRLWSAVLLQRQASGGRLPQAAVVPWLDDDRTPLRRSAVRALPRLAVPPPSTLHRVAELLADPAAQDDARAALLALGPRAAAAVPALVELLDGEPYVSPSVPVEILGAIGPAAVVAVPALAQHAAGRLGSPNDADLAGRALARIAPEAAAKLLFEELARDQAGSDTQHRCATALRALGAKAAGVLPQLLGLLERGAPESQIQALGIVAAIGPRAAPALPCVLQILASHRPELGPPALLALGALGTGQASAAAEVGRWLRDADAGTRRSLLGALPALGPAAEPVLRGAASDPDAAVRQAAEQGLARLRDPNLKR